MKPAIQLDKEPAITVREPDTITQPPPQDHQLMPKRRVLGFKPQPRLERRGKDRQHETEKPDHLASLGDFATSSTRTRFSVHTTAGKKLTTGNKAEGELAASVERHIEPRKNSRYKGR
jgi:hypothetical protein